MARTPRQVRILSHLVGIAMVADLQHEGEDDEHAHRAYGVFDPGVPAIYLDKASGDERTKVTLVHEALHAMLNISKLDAVEDEEELVGRLAPVLLDFLRSNKRVVAYLQEVK